MVITIIAYGKIFYDEKNKGRHVTSLIMPKNVTIDHTQLKLAPLSISE